MTILGILCNIYIQTPTSIAMSHGGHVQLKMFSRRRRELKPKTTKKRVNEIFNISDFGVTF